MTSLRRLAAPLALALGLTACGGDSDSTDPATDPTPDGAQSSAEPDAGTQSAEPDAGAVTGAAPAAGDFPVTLDSAGGEVTLEEAPERIVSLSPSATEVLFAVGAGDQVVAVDEFSYYPEEAPVTDLSGFDPNVEAITTYEPDLVVISNDANDLVASLTDLDIPVYVNEAPADIEGGYAGMADLGAVTGHADETAALVSDLRADIETALSEAPDEPVRVYHELDDSFFSASSYGFVGSVYAEMGATNIADEADVDQSGFPQLTEEAVIAADPELIVITDQVGYTAEDVAARPGWADVTAVREGNITTVDADIASRWGPRLPEFVGAAAEALSAVAVPAR